MGEQLVQRPEAGELQTVQGVIQLVVAEQLQLLDADRRQQRQRADALRRRARDLQGHAAAHAEADDVDRAEFEGVEQLQGVVGVGADRVVGNVAGRSAEAGEIGRDDETIFRDVRRQVGEVVGAAGTAVQHEDR